VGKRDGVDEPVGLEGARCFVVVEEEVHATSPPTLLVVSRSSPSVMERMASSKSALLGVVTSQSVRYSMRETQRRRTRCPVGVVG
jgi:hypothetical protein